MRLALLILWIVKLAHPALVVIVECPEVQLNLEKIVQPLPPSLSRAQTSLLFITK